MAKGTAKAIEPKVEVKETAPAAVEATVEDKQTERAPSDDEQKEPTKTTEIYFSASVPDSALPKIEAQIHATLAQCGFVAAEVNNRPVIAGHNFATLQTCKGDAGVALLTIKCQQICKASRVANFKLDIQVLETK